jgi:putative ABC transport system permease protein
MGPFEHLRLAIRALSVNKLRSILTMLGIIIGVGAVIALLSVGQGVQALVSENLQSVGTNLLFIASGNLEDQDGPPGRNGVSGLTISMSDYRALADPVNTPDLAAVAPEVLGSGEITHGRTTLRTSISGVTPEYESVRNFPVTDGAFISDEDVNTKARVAVLGSRIAERLFLENGLYPIGATVKLSNVPFKVIGVLEEKGGFGGPGGNQDEQVLVPLTTAHQRLFPRFHDRGGEPLLTVVYAQVVSEDRMVQASEEIASILRERHDIRFQDEDDFSIISQQDLLSIFGQITGVLTLFLGAIAGISLLVGGIGIMNIMLVSVTERTREIGLRKAVGAKGRDILWQFLIEAVVLSIIGGLLGIGLGIAGAFAISRLQDDLTAVVTPQAILLATGFSAAVGLFFGIYPASRAAKLNPIEALRYE